MTLASGLEIPLDVLAGICRRYRVRELSVFGSAARGGIHAASDVDLAVVFEPGYHPGIEWFDLEDQLETALGRRVDLTQKSLLKPRVRREAERDAVIIYAA